MTKAEFGEKLAALEKFIRDPAAQMRPTHTDVAEHAPGLNVTGHASRRARREVPVRQGPEAGRHVEARVSARAFRAERSRNRALGSLRDGGYRPDFCRARPGPRGERQPKPSRS